MRRGRLKAHLPQTFFEIEITHRQQRIMEAPIQQVLACCCNITLHCRRGLGDNVRSLFDRLQ